MIQETVEELSYEVLEYAGRQIAVQQFLEMSVERHIGWWKKLVIEEMSFLA